MVNKKACNKSYTKNVPKNNFPNCTSKHTPAKCNPTFFLSPDTAFLGRITITETKNNKLINR